MSDTQDNPEEVGSGPRNDEEALLLVQLINDSVEEDYAGEGE